MLCCSDADPDPKKNPPGEGVSTCDPTLAVHLIPGPVVCSAAAMQIPIRRRILPAKASALAILLWLSILFLVPLYALLQRCRSRSEEESSRRRRQHLRSYSGCPSYSWSRCMLCCSDADPDPKKNPPGEGVSTCDPT